MTHKQARKIWVEALRSGRFEQGQCRLNMNGRMCCLGVACELYIENGGSLEKATLAPGTVTYDDAAAVPPDAVIDWLGLATPDGQYEKDGWFRDLVRDNDSGKSFLEIAQIIEDEPEGLTAPE